MDEISKEDQLRVEAFDRMVGVATDLLAEGLQLIEAADSARVRKVARLVREALDRAGTEMSRAAEVFDETE